MNRNETGSELQFLQHVVVRAIEGNARFKATLISCSLTSSQVIKVAAALTNLLIKQYSNDLEKVPWHKETTYGIIEDVLLVPLSNQEKAARIVTTTIRAHRKTLQQ